MFKFLLIGSLALALVLGQLLLLRPSARDRALIRLRSAARSEGFTVQLVARPVWVLPGHSQRVASYRVDHDQPCRRTGEWRMEQRVGHWSGARVPEDVLAYVVACPASRALLGIVADAAGVELVWDESLSPDQVPALYQMAREIGRKFSQNQ